MRKYVILLLALLFFTIPSVIAETPESTLGKSGVPQQAQAGSWATMAPMPTARTQMGVAVVDGKIYAIGGTTQTSEDFPRTKDVGTNEMYDPTTDTWAIKATMPIPMSDFAIAAYQGKIYCFQFDLLEIYNSATDMWTNETIPEIGEEVQANVDNGTIYLIGSLHNIEDGNFNIAYDPQTNTMTTKASIQLTDKQSIDAIPHNHDLFSTPYVDSRGFWDGRGASVTLSNGEIFWASILNKGTLVFNSTNNSWSHSTAPTPSYVNPYVAAATTGEWAPQQLYIFNENDNAVLNSLVFSYNSATDQWDKCTSLPSSRAWYGVAVVDDQLYVIGGETSRGCIWYDGLWLKVNTSNLTERYTPAGYGTVAPSVSVVSLQNGTVASGNVAFNVSVNRPIAQLTYSLDGQDNATFTGTLNLSEIPAGAHNVTVYATDAFGNVGASETVYFTVEQERQSSPFMTVVAVAVVAVAVIGLVIYLKRNKRG